MAQKKVAASSTKKTEDVRRTIFHTIMSIGVGQGTNSSPVVRKRNHPPGTYVASKAGHDMRMTTRRITWPSTWQRAAFLGILIAALGIPPDQLAAFARQAQQGPQSIPAPQAEPPTPPSSQPQTRRQAPPDAQPPVAISVQSNLVNLEAVVTDQDGNIVTGLKRENFEISDNGVPQQVTNFAPTDAPITMVMLVEFSATAYGYFGYKSQMWADGFLQHLAPKDWVALKTFDMRPTLQVDFTQNKGEIHNALASLGFPSFHEAALFDALFTTVDELRTVKGKKSILLICTGFDTISHHRLDETYKLMKEADLSVFAVGMGEEIDLSSGGGNISYLQAKNQLSSFAQMTGGYAWFPRFTGEMGDIFNSVAAFLRNQYTVGFSPTTPQDGKYHKLQVTVVDAAGAPMMLNDRKGKKHKVQVYFRQGYNATAPASAGN
jgi:VWFA-related protein